jgi:large subunit ribosomal protein L35
LRGALRVSLSLGVSFILSETLEKRRGAALAFVARHRYIAPLEWAAGRVPRRRRPQTDLEMPKLKTKSGAKKRFGRTATGKIKRNWGYKRHRLISKSTQGKRLRRGTTTMEPGDAKLVLTYMPYLRS